MFTHKDRGLKDLVKKAYEEGSGIFRLAPTWVYRPLWMGKPGGRLKLDPRNLYSERGGVSERWLSSTTKAESGPGTPEDEGLSYVVVNDKKAFLLRDAIQLEGTLILGKEIMEKYGGWKMFSKFFDYVGPLGHHLHIREEHAKLVGKKQKLEHYYFPPQLNFYKGLFPYTYFGLVPGTSKKDIKRCLKNWHEGDNGILDYSVAYRLQVGTGWIVQPGILHAPGSLVTYEPQQAWDIYSEFQSMLYDNTPVPWEAVVKDIPCDKKNDLDFIVDLIDWPANLDPHFREHHHHEAVLITENEAYKEKWIVYGTNDLFSAKELTVFPGKSATIKDNGAYGLIVVQGYGRIGKLSVESPTMIGYKDLTYDELFVSFEAARAGIVITNKGHESLLILKHFGPGTNASAPLVGTDKI